MDKYLQDISRDKRYWERKRDEIRRERKRLEGVTLKYESDLEEINKQKREILAEAKKQAEQILSESNALIENTVREIKETKADKEKTKLARQKISVFKENLESQAINENDNSKGDLKRKENKKGVLKQKGKSSKKSSSINELKPGDFVRLNGQTTHGEIMEISGKKATVAFGMIKSTVDINKLEAVSSNQIKKEKKLSNTRDLLHERKLNFKQDIDVRGMRGDEALQAVMYFIDDAVQLGMSRVRILHGTGTGALRQIIREYLATVNGVAHFQDEHVQFGGAGITVIDIE
jgi:DNA mismatch repair protein MutS2